MRMEMKSYYWSIGDDNVTIEQENDATVITQVGNEDETLLLGMTKLLLRRKTMLIGWVMRMMKILLRIKSYN